ncbi:hypothetical protein PCASD_01104 [Puccinia coronata f. sp. avenae]|uniref:Uncharacterized protein n=1 Tax=Puccinia coronata f. sp. avenae TaxID=200324 RepID=A0A2N5RWJ1_9BASI|nr:hypothetical protein PCASD_25480 [Puccinia coronata f. sp. avenae]PLW50954.1 hypothetical protein PCASD_01104 [Puccinia coronata f. sp. avenae]
MPSGHAQVNTRTVFSISIVQLVAILLILSNPVTSLIGDTCYKCQVGKFEDQKDELAKGTACSFKLRCKHNVPQQETCKANQLLHRVKCTHCGHRDSIYGPVGPAVHTRRNRPGIAHFIGYFNHYRPWFLESICLSASSRRSERLWTERIWPKSIVPWELKSAKTRFTAGLACTKGLKLLCAIPAPIFRGDGHST